MFSTREGMVIDSGGAVGRPGPVNRRGAVSGRRGQRAPAQQLRRYTYRPSFDSCRMLVCFLQ